jgi:serine/threonine-protein kinase
LVNRYSQKIRQSLQKIDRLWTKNSGRRFGFTPHKKAYLATENNFNDYVESTYEAFGDRLSWRIFGSWKRYQDFNFQKIDTAMTPQPRKTRISPG